jgi:hypothetical protein
MENNLQPEAIVSSARQRPSLRIAGYVLGVALCGVVLAVGAFSAKPVSPPEAKRKTVVVELFTSEGCSSCPPADALLVKLREEGRQNGAEIIPLGFHVDYWNHLGWQDRFSSAAYSQRQEQYARIFSLDSVYTPQMVVDGRREFVGSGTSRARDEITQETGQPQQADVQLSLAFPDKLLVQVSASSNDLAGDVVLAITEDNLSSNIAAGENSGHVLRHAAVVRELRSLGKLVQSKFQAEIPITQQKDWKSKDLRYVVFVQNASSRRIEGAASLPASR